MLQKGKQLSSMHKDISKLTQKLSWEKSLFSSNLVRGVTLSRVDLKIERLVSREKCHISVSFVFYREEIQLDEVSSILIFLSILFLLVLFLKTTKTSIHHKQGKLINTHHQFFFSSHAIMIQQPIYQANVFCRDGAVGWAINGLNKLFQLAVFSPKGFTPSTTQKTHKR